jgi:PAS domain S-box-containing protein
MGLRVLIVDANLAERSLLQEAFAKASLGVSACATLMAARQALARGSYSAIVVDLELPDGDAVEFLRELKGTPSTAQTPAILLGVEGKAQLRAKTQPAQPGARVGKPVDPKALVELALSLIGARQAEPKPPLAPAPKATILVVDDAGAYPTALALELRQEGYLVLVAGSGQEALATLQSQPVDCVLLALVLPGLSGEATCRRIREAQGFREVPVIMLSAKEEREALVPCIQAGADDYVTKSADFGVLRARLYARLRQRQRTNHTPLRPDRSESREIDVAAARAARALAKERAAHLGDLQREHEKLARAHTQLAEAQALAHIGSWEWDVAKNQVSWSEELYRIYGVEPRALLPTYEAFLDRIHTADRARADALLQAAYEEKTTFDFEHRIVRPTGEVRVVHTLGRVVLGATGELLRLSGIGADITERKQVEAAIRQSEERFRMLAASSPVGIFEMELGGNVTYANAKLERLGGPLSSFGPAFFSAVHPDERDAFLEAWHECADATSEFSREVRFVQRGREPRWVHVRAMPLHAVDDAVAGWVGTIEDIQKRIAAQFALQDATRAAEFANRAKSQFLANMSHELRTPLNAIIGFSEVLEKEMFGPLAAVQKDCVENVLTSGRHLLGLINETLDLSKIEAGKMALNREWTELATLMGTVHSVVPLAEKRQITLKISVPSDLPRLYADPVRIKQILYNLLSNGIKFTPIGGSVHLSASAEGNYLKLVVADTGPGIRSEDLPRLFREFERLEPIAPEPGEPPEGTGLGLALTKRLVEMHGGSISVHSEVGKGTSFTVQLPLADTAEPRSIREDRP